MDKSKDRCIVLRMDDIKMDRAINVDILIDMPRCLVFNWLIDTLIERLIHWRKHNQ